MGKVIQEKSFQFAVRIVNLCKYLQTEQKEYVLTRQLLRCRNQLFIPDCHPQTRARQRAGL